MWVNKVTLLTKWEEKMRKNCCDLGHALTMDKKRSGFERCFPFGYLAFLLIFPIRSENIGWRFTTWTFCCQNPVCV